MRTKRSLIILSLFLGAVLACNLPTGQNTAQPNLSGTNTGQALTLQTQTSSPGNDTPTETLAVISTTPKTGGQSEYPSPAPPATQSAKTPQASPAPVAGTPSKPITILPLPIVRLPPSAPTNLSASRTCTSTKINYGLTIAWVEGVKLAWKDNATNEIGYHIYRNGALAFTIAANSTDYHITLHYNTPLFVGLITPTSPAPDAFGVEAYNSFGASARPTVDVHRCA